MLSIETNRCIDCDEIKELLSQLDSKLARLAKKKMDHLQYLSADINRRETRNLIYYRDILENIYWNIEYYSFPYQQIISKIKSDAF